MIVGGEDALPEERARFRAEAQAIASLKHPNIVQIHEVIEHEGRLFSPWNSSKEAAWARHVKGTPMPAPLAVDLVEQLARAIHFVHQQGIIHRDLNPPTYSSKSMNL